MQLLPLLPFSLNSFPSIRLSNQSSRLDHILLRVHFCNNSTYYGVTQNQHYLHIHLHSQTCPVPGYRTCCADSTIHSLRRRFTRGTGTDSALPTYRMQLSRSASALFSPTRRTCILPRCCCRCQPVRRYRPVDCAGTCSTPR